jgi:hypothetical protein
MNVDFVNVYIKKQKALIDDLQSRLLISESSLELANQEINNLKNQLEAASTVTKKAKPVPSES